MKLLCFMANDEAHLGLKTPGGVLDLTAAGYPKDMAAIIRDAAAATAEIASLAAGSALPLLDADKLRYLAPACATSKVICVGLNYRAHVEETSSGAEPDYPKDPILFSKFHNALNGHNCPVALSANAKNFDYEAELVVVIGKGGMDIPRDKASGHIFGYACGNDVSARDAQNLTRQWLIGKSFPGFAPVGPWIVTADEIADPCRLAITCKRGGQTVQSGNTAQMIFDIDTLISFASRYIRLEPGDLIFTGTPDGVIVGKEPGKQDWLMPGEEVTVSIEGIGDLTSRSV